jgi:hypothetical protein
MDFELEEDATLLVIFKPDHDILIEELDQPTRKADKQSARPPRHHLVWGKVSSRLNSSFIFGWVWGIFFSLFFYLI